MKMYLSAFLFFVVSLVFPQEKVKVTINITAPTLSDTSNVYIAGNKASLGNWNPGKVKMQKGDGKIWSLTVEVDKNSRLEYKITKGSWATEALGNELTVPQNSILTAVKDTAVNTTILNWRDNNNFKVNGQITGKVYYHKEFVIDGLKPRDIFVWLPPDYEEKKDKRYPVFYMHDGQNLVDPRSSNTFIDWQVDETADSLIRKGEIVSFIIVGINNTSDRSAEYSSTPLGRLYGKLVTEKIKSFVDSNYRTLPGAENTAVGGSSMGGLISFIFAWEYPDVFSKAACFSPAFKYENFDYTKTVLNDSSPKRKISLYIDNGGIGLERILQPGVDAMVKALKGKGYSEGKEFNVFIDPGAEHNEAAWAKRAWRPMKQFFGKE